MRSRKTRARTRRRTHHERDEDALALVVDALDHRLVLIDLSLAASFAVSRVVVCAVVVNGPFIEFEMRRFCHPVCVVLSLMCCL